MNKIKTMLMAVGLVLLVLVALLLSTKIFKPRMAGLNINTTPSSIVLVNNQKVGTTPYKDFFKPGRYVIRLLPESKGAPLDTYDTEVYLEKGVETVMRRNFGLVQDEDSGYLLSFEKIGGSGASISIVTEPDGAEVTLDGNMKSIAPYRTTLPLSGNHDITVKKEGFLENSFRVMTYKGYQLIAVVKLAKGSSDSGIQKNETNITGTPEVGELVDKGMGFVEIVDTPTGFLRIRSEASTLGTEVGQAKPGKKYIVVGVDSKTGWYKIEYDLEKDGKTPKTGWVSNLYVKRVGEKNVLTTPAPTP